jgi:hypothetical protein
MEPASGSRRPYSTSDEKWQAGIHGDSSLYLDSSCHQEAKEATLSRAQVQYL